MPLLNYTTTIAVTKTLGEVIEILSSHGARSILIDYAAGTPAAVKFLVPTAYGDQGFRLPIQADAIWTVLTRQQRAGKVAPRFVTKEQAARVGWRIVKDWLAAQMAIVETEMVTFDQAMLAYMLVAGDKTLYETVIDLGGPKLALGAGSEANHG